MFEHAQHRQSTTVIEKSSCKSGSIIKSCSINAQINITHIYIVIPHFLNTP